MDQANVIITESKESMLIAGNSETLLALADKAEKQCDPELAEALRLLSSRVIPQLIY